MLFDFFHSSSLVFAVPYTEKDLFQSGNAYPVGVQIQAFELAIKVMEKVFELGSGVVWKLVATLSGNFLEFDCFWDAQFYKLVHFRGVF